MAEKKKKTTRRRRKPAGKAGGPPADELQSAAAPAEVAALGREVERDGGKVLGAYAEPYGGKWVIFAALPIDQVEPTPYQRNLSDAHARRLENVIGKLGRFLDPIIAVRAQKSDEIGRASCR